MFCELTHIHIKVKWGFFDQGQPHAPCGFYRRGNLGLGRGVGRGLGFGLDVGVMITGPRVIIVMFPIFFSLPAFRMALLLEEACCIKLTRYGKNYMKS